MSRLYDVINVNVFEGEHNSPDIRIECVQTDVHEQIKRLVPSSKLVVQLKGYYGVMQDIPMEFWNTDDGKAIIAGASHDILIPRAFATIIVVDKENFYVKPYRGDSTWELLGNKHLHVIVNHENDCVVVINRGC